MCTSESSGRLGKKIPRLIRAFEHRELRLRLLPLDALRRLQPTGRRRPLPHPAELFTQDLDPVLPVGLAPLQERDVAREPLAEGLSCRLERRHRELVILLGHARGAQPVVRHHQEGVEHRGFEIGRAHV